MIPPPPRSTLFPYTTLFRSVGRDPHAAVRGAHAHRVRPHREGDGAEPGVRAAPRGERGEGVRPRLRHQRSEEHTSELQSRRDLVCRLLLEKKNKKRSKTHAT